MAEYVRAHPNCVNASNPYHECGMACLEKIAQGQGQVQKEKKKFDNRNGIKEGAVSKKKDDERKVHSNCSKASNPYHACDENCFKRNGETNALGVKKESAGSWSFGRKKKGPESQPNSPQPNSPQPMSPRVLNNVPVVNYHQDARHPRSEVYSKKKVEPKNDESFYSSEQHSGEIYHQDFTFDKDLVQSTQLVPSSRNVVKADKPKEPSKDNITSLLGAILAKPEKETDADVQNVKEGDANVQDVKEGKANYQDVEEGKANYQDVEEGKANYQDVEEGNVNYQDAVESHAGQVAYMKFSFSSIDHPPKDSDDEETESVISDSCVSVGKYHVKARISSILQSIFDKYGDIAANCRLESVSMRAYYLECLCSVVQELQSTPLAQMTKAKVKEMLAVLKDVESAQIDVDWLRDILSEVSESIEVVTQHQTFKTAKANCDSLLESTRKQLESQMEDLALKEKDLADAKARVAETRARVSELESESSQLNKTIESIQSKVEKLNCKSLRDEHLE